MATGCELHAGIAAWCIVGVTNGLKQQTTLIVHVCMTLRDDRQAQQTTSMQLFKFSLDILTIPE